MQTYLVGGAVRDALLGLPVKDRDWVVVGADADTMQGQRSQHETQAVPEGAGLSCHFRTVGITVENGEDAHQSHTGGKRQPRAERNQPTEHQH